LAAGLAVEREEPGVDGSTACDGVTGWEDPVFGCWACEVGMYPAASEKPIQVVSTKTRKGDWPRADRTSLKTQPS